MSAEQPTILPWHREAAKELFPIPAQDNPWGDIHHEKREHMTAIIARHDERRTDSPALRLLKNQHAETLRLLERTLTATEVLCATLHTIGTDPLEQLCDEVRAHLAAMKGTQ